MAGATTSRTLKDESRLEPKRRKNISTTLTLFENIAGDEFQGQTILYKISNLDAVKCYCLSRARRIGGRMSFSKQALVTTILETNRNHEYAMTLQ